MIEEHNAAQARAAAASEGDVSRSNNRDPFSLDGWEQGTAADLIEFGQTINAVRRQDGSVVKPNG